MENLAVAVAPSFAPAVARPVAFPLCIRAPRVRSPRLLPRPQPLKLSPLRAKVAINFWRAADDLPALKKAGLDIAELRLDLADEDARQLAKSFRAIPTICTLRAADEGGRWTGNDKETAARLLQCLPFVAAVDIELARADAMSEVIKRAKQKNVALIFSRHNCAQTDSLQTIEAAAAAAFSKGASVFKIACAVKTKSDFGVLQTFLQTWKKHPIVVIGMGDNKWARATRINFPRQGSRITFAALNGVVAPGQLPFADAVKFLRQ